MSKKTTRSIRGEIVDFDLLEVKASMERRRKTNGVENREQYIDIKRRRNPRRSVADLEAEQNKNVADAREKMRKSKQNRKDAENEKVNSAELSEDKVVTNVDEGVEETPDETPEVTKEARQGKKRIVKNKG